MNQLTQRAFEMPESGSEFSELNPTEKINLFRQALVGVYEAEAGTFSLPLLEHNLAKFEKIYLQFLKRVNIMPNCAARTAARRVFGDLGLLPKEKFRPVKVKRGRSARVSRKIPPVKIENGQHVFVV